MLWGDAEHWGAKATGVVERDNLLAFRRKLFAHAIHEVNLSSDSEHRSRWRLLDHLQQPFSRTDSIRLLANFPAAFRVNDNLNPRIFSADVVNMFRKKSLVDRAMTLPQNCSGILQPLGRESATNHVRVPNDHLIQRNSQVVAGVAAQMLIRSEEHTSELQSHSFISY